MRSATAEQRAVAAEDDNQVHVSGSSLAASYGCTRAASASCAVSLSNTRETSRAVRATSIARRQVGDGRASAPRLATMPTRRHDRGAPEVEEELRLPGRR